MGRWTVGVRGRLHDEFGMHAKKIDSNRQHNSSPNTGDNLFPPCPNHERDINAPPPPKPLLDATSSRPYRPNFCCV